MTTIAQGLVDWAWSLDSRAVPAEVTQAATRHILDGLGNAVASYRLQAVSHAVNVALRGSSTADATILGSGLRTSAHMAAFANGCLIHGLDFDDTHGEALVHPTACVLPAALATAEEGPASGKDLVHACVIGYETMIRLGATVRHGFHARGFHATSVCGVFGAALAAAHLFGLDRLRAVQALGIAGSFASGSLEFLETGSTTKQLQPGWAAMAGVMAARLAEAGATGPNSIFEGTNGFYRAYAASNVAPQQVLEGLGDEWKLTSITMKCFPVCQLAHSSLDALMRASVDDTSVDNVQGFTFDIPRESVPIICEPCQTKIAPRNGYEAKFSLQWSAAALLLDGTLTIDTFNSTQVTRPDVLALSRRIAYQAYDSPIAAADSRGRVEITMRDGQLLRFEVPHSHGSPGSPLSNAEVVEKFVRNCGGEEAAARAVAGLVLRVAELDDLTRILGRPPLTSATQRAR